MAYKQIAKYVTVSLFTAMISSGIYTDKIYRLELSHDTKIGSMKRANETIIRDVKRRSERELDSEVRKYKQLCLDQAWEHLCRDRKRDGLDPSKYRKPTLGEMYMSLPGGGGALL
uniref:Uncharacterized protein n=1 Tax=Pithovirus LCPAC403 TaxID=2506596 RepID=A0A481ZBB4_9VIRU|nr:MAG: hypothetical protein LCPAC403_03280 [Pithovirus LCPAC403]